MKNEGRVTSALESYTRHIPSLLFLGLALGAIGASAGMMAGRRRHWALLIGEWAPVFLILGTYNKIAKTFSAPYSEAQRLRHGDHPRELHIPEAHREERLSPS